MAERRYTTIFGAALVTAALATFGIYRVLQASKAQNRVITRPVVIAFKDVSEGKAIDRASVTVAEWPVNTIPAGAYASVDSVVNRVTRVDVFRGEVLVPGRSGAGRNRPRASGQDQPGQARHLRAHRRCLGPERHGPAEQPRGRPRRHPRHEDAEGRREDVHVEHARAGGRYDQPDERRQPPDSGGRPSASR